MYYLKVLKAKYPEVTAFEEDDDYWDTYGFEALKKKNYELAEMYFGKLCLSQPKHHSGFEGLAYTYYLIRDFDKAESFMKRAIEIAKTFLIDESIDIVVIQEMEENYSNIVSRKPLLAWWSK